MVQFEWCASLLGACYAVALSENSDKLGRAMERARSSGEAMAPGRVRLLAVVNCAILVDDLVSEWASQRERASAERGTPSPHGIRHGTGGVLVTAGAQKSWGWSIGAKPDQLGIPQSPINSCIGTIAGGSRGDGVAPLCMSSPCQAHVKPMSSPCQAPVDN